MTYTILLFVLLQSGLIFVVGEKQMVAMDRIILANMGKEKQMNVHKFDIRLPPFRSDAGEGQFNAAARDERKLWVKGVVPYVIHKSILDRPMFKKNLEKAMKEWKTYTCVTFRKRKRKHRDYVVFMYGVGCNADVGRRGGRQYVSLGRGCSDTSVIIHELGHVAGFWHEQNRPDRSKYVDILWNNIIPDYRFAFDKYHKVRINSRNVTYDFKSIMHYGNYAFSSNKKETIVARNRNIKEFGNIHLSPLDIKQANLVYNCPDKKTEFPRFPEDFKFSMKEIRGKHCVLLNEPKDRQYQSVYLCHNKTKKGAGISWSHQGKLPSLDCTGITLPDGRGSTLGWWNDNYLCVANDSVYKFHWSESGPVAGIGCLKWPSKSRRNNRKAFLCAKFYDGPIDGGWTEWSPWTECNRICGGGYQEQRRYCTNPVPKNYGKPCYGKDYNRRFCNLQKCTEQPIWPDDFMFKKFSQTPYDHNCVHIYDRASELSWRNYYFCSFGNKTRTNMKWSVLGTQPGMRCIKVNEPDETGGWENNYLCVPANSDLRFQWSHSGPIRNLACMKWFAKNGSDGWNDNYLCGPQQPKKKMAALSIRAEAPEVAESTDRKAIIHGVWSAWTSWSQCSKTCGEAYQKRTRTCSKPLGRGKQCIGGRMEARRCALEDCPNSCYGVFTQSSGKLISPNFPNYPHNSLCYWTIKVEKGKKIEIKFTYIRLKANKSRCATDNIIVRNGENNQARILKLFCSNTNSAVTLESSGNALFLRLRTSDHLKTGGFKAEWTSKSIQEKGPCHKQLSGNSGSFTSPSYPQKYPINKECTWLISVPLDRLLQIQFQDFNLEKQSKCSYDRVEVYDGGTLKSPKKIFCGVKNPGKITAFTNRMLIRFKSDATRNYRGFKLTWFTSKRRL